MPPKSIKSNTTLDPSTTGAFDSDERKRVKDIMINESDDPGESGTFVYSRYGNPTVAAAETKVSEVALSFAKSAAWVVLTASGMAAIDCALSILQTPGRPPDGRPWLLCPGELYGGTLKYIQDVLIGRRGIPVEKVKIQGGDVLSAPGITDEFIEQIKNRRPSVVFFEPVTNPTLCVFDVRRIIQAARDISATVVVDNTFTPMVIRPLELGEGAHLVVHSVTKSLSGHGNITAGIVCGRTPPVDEFAPIGRSPRKLKAAVRDWRKTVGCILSPRDAFELLAEMETLELRLRTANSNALELARFLSAHVNQDKVACVRYPGLEDHPNRDAITANFERDFGYGSMVTIDLRTEEAVLTFMDAIEPYGIECRLTLGDVATTVVPIKNVFGIGSDRFDKYPGLLRISVGIERCTYLKDTFGAVLSKI